MHLKTPAVEADDFLSQHTFGQGLFKIFGAIVFNSTSTTSYVTGDAWFFTSLCASASSFVEMMIIAPTVKSCSAIKLDNMCQSLDQYLCHQLLLLNMARAL